MNTIMLDLAGLNALFPPGSEARVELRRVAVTEFSARVIGDVSKLSEETQQAIYAAVKERSNAVQAAIDKAVRDYENKVQAEGLISYIKPTAWSSAVNPTFTLTGEAEKLIKQAIEDAFYRRIHQAVVDQLPALVENYLNKLKIDKLIDLQLTTLLQTESGKKIKALLGT